MLILFKLLSHCPLVLLHPLGWLGGWLAFLFSPVYRARFLANARQAGYGFGAVHAAVGEGGKLVSELPRLWLGRSVPVAWEGEALIEAAHRQGRGIIFLTPHLGCFEVTAQAYAARYGPEGRHITVLYRPSRKPALRALMERVRARDGQSTAPTTLAGVRQLIKALSAGQAVGLLPDQVPPAGLGVWAAFFGRDAYTMTLSARLARQSGAQVLLAWGERLGWGRGYRIHLRAPDGPLPADPAEAARQINRAMEALIRECPQQYLWGYARYKTPATQGAAA